MYGFLGWDYYKNGDTSMMRRIEPLGRTPILHDAVSSGDEMVSGVVAKEAISARMQSTNICMMRMAYRCCGR
jgi:hypothetical protein